MEPDCDCPTLSTFPVTHTVLPMWSGAWSKGMQSLARTEVVSARARSRRSMSEVYGRAQRARRTIVPNNGDDYQSTSRLRNLSKSKAVWVVITSEARDPLFVSR